MGNKMRDQYFIFTADWHLRHIAPVCRIDDFYDTMFNKVRFVFETASFYNAPIIVGGDLGHYCEWDNCLLYNFITLKKEFSHVKIMTTPGQHDLSYHKFASWKHSGTGVLNAVGLLDVVSCEKIKNTKFYFFPFGKEMQHNVKTEGYKTVAVIHQMVIQKQLWAGQRAKTGLGLLKEFPEYDIIVCGDNHLPFVEKDKDRFLINCGSLMRTTQDQRKHKPRVYLWDSVKNKIEEIYIPIKKNVFRKNLIDSFDNKNAELFVRTIKKYGGYNNEFSFKENLRKFIGENIDNFGKDTFAKINEAIALESKK